MSAIRSWSSAASIGLCLLTLSEARAGPPFRTDDPEPVDTGHFEFYTFSEGLRSRDHTSATLPGAELNYGLIPNGQLTIGGEAATSAARDASNHYGVGDTNLSFKYRFINETPLSPQVSIYPEIDFPTGSRPRNLGAGHVRVFFPVWLQKSFGNWTTYGGGGYAVYENAHLGDKNNWFFGWLLERKITDSLTLGGEIFDQTADNVDVKNETGFNVGGTYDLDAHDHLNVSLGRDIQTAQYNWYFGWEFTY
jgi:outer membrane putative beta-barrel porin/alpha-amylase